MYPEDSVRNIGNLTLDKQSLHNFRSVDTW